jgi:hypothetical protein
MLAARTIGHHFSISALWCTASASGRLLLARWDDLAEVGQPLTHAGIGQRIHDGGIKLGDDVLRRARLLEFIIPSAQSVPVTATDLIDPKKKRQFSSIGQLAKEQCNVRIWGGIHFRNSLDVGMDMGKRMAEYMVEHSLNSVLLLLAEQLLDDLGHALRLESVFS